jgi:hypothetical protein
MSLDTFYANLDNIEDMGYSVLCITYFHNPEVIWDQIWFVVSVYSYSPTKRRSPPDSGPIRDLFLMKSQKISDRIFPPGFIKFLKPDSGF